MKHFRKEPQEKGNVNEEFSEERVFCAGEEARVRNFALVEGRLGRAHCMTNVSPGVKCAKYIQ